MLIERDVPEYICDRCRRRFNQYEDNKAQRHTNSDADHVTMKKVGYAKRGIAGVIFYPICSAGRDILGYGDTEDEKWLEKPIYQIFIQDPDGKERDLQTVEGSTRAQLVLWEIKEELAVKEGGPVRGYIRRIIDEISSDS